MPSYNGPISKTAMQAIVQAHYTNDLARHLQTYTGHPIRLRKLQEAGKVFAALAAACQATIANIPPPRDFVV